MLKDTLNSKSNDNVYPRIDSKAPMRKDVKRKAENELNSESSSNKISKYNCDSPVSDSDEIKFSYLKHPKTEVLITLSEAF